MHLTTMLALPTVLSPGKKKGESIARQRKEGRRKVGEQEGEEGNG